jgi:hypothetical protein
MPRREISAKYLQCRQTGAATQTSSGSLTQSKTHIVHLHQAKALRIQTQTQIKIQLLAPSSLDHLLHRAMSFTAITQEQFHPSSGSLAHLSKAETHLPPPHILSRPLYRRHLHFLQTQAQVQSLLATLTIITITETSLSLPHTWKHLLCQHQPPLRLQVLLRTTSGNQDKLCRMGMYLHPPHTNT